MILQLHDYVSRSSQYECRTEFIGRGEEETRILYISQIFQMQRRSFGLVGNSQLLVKSSQNLCPDL